jgi:hypothetical protein
MDRRTFIGALSGLLVAPLVAEGQQRRSTSAWREVM